MKTLVIRQPWAYLIVSGHKVVENRSWNTAHRGPFLIQSSGAFSNRDYQAAQEICDKLGIKLPAKQDLALGCIVGRAELTHIVETSKDPFFFGPKGWMLSKAIACKPRPIKGRLGFYESGLRISGKKVIEE